jgi:hypothetical protein
VAADRRLSTVDPFMTDFEKTVLADLSELKAHMRWLVGNGNAGCVHELAERVEQHEKVIQRAGGIGAALAVFITLVNVAIDFLRLHFGR